MPLARNTVAFAVAYLLLMVPTYVLPYFGSNSTLLNGITAAIGVGPTPQWWAHVWLLSMLVILAWIRGGAIGKSFLPIFPGIAGTFDMVPGLSVVPLVPTVMHILSLVIGAKGEASDGGISLRGATVFAGIATVCAIGGSAMFVATAARKAEQIEVPVAAKAQSAPSPVVPAPVPVSMAMESPTAVAKPMAIAPAVRNHPKVPARQSTIGATEQKAPAPAPAKPEVRYINLND